MAASMRDLAAELDAPVLVCLEGGYDLDALAASVVATLAALAGSRRAAAAPAGAGRALRRAAGRHWPALRERGS